MRPEAKRKPVELLIYIYTNYSVRFYINIVKRHSFIHIYEQKRGTEVWAFSQAVETREYLNNLCKYSYPKWTSMILCFLCFKIPEATSSVYVDILLVFPIPQFLPMYFSSTPCGKDITNIFTFWRLKACEGSCSASLHSPSSVGRLAPTGGAWDIHDRANKPAQLSPSPSPWVSAEDQCRRLSATEQGRRRCSNVDSPCLIQQQPCSHRRPHLGHLWQLVTISSHCMLTKWWPGRQGLQILFPSLNRQDSMWVLEPDYLVWILTLLLTSSITLGKSFNFLCASVALSIILPSRNCHEGLVEQYL